MNLFKLVTVLGLLLSSNHMALGMPVEEGKYPPCILRGVTVKDQSRVGIVSKDESKVPSRKIDCQFSVVSPFVDWSIYRFENAVGLFWTEKEHEAFKILKTAGAKIDFDPESKHSFIPEETLKGMIVTAEKFEIPLWKALLEYSIDENGILVITQ